MCAKNELSARFIAAYEALIDSKKVTDKRDFALKIGISPSMVTEISKGRSNVGTLAVQNIVSVFNIDADWLLTGRGKMLKSPSTPSTPQTPVKSHHEQEAIPLAEINGTGNIKPIPLVTETAAAGFGNEYFSIAEKDVKEYYVIPKFRFCRVDFMIEVSGLSMYPHFNPGDVIACTILHDRKFLQWNKCHVIATREQGILVKRLMPSKHEGCLTAISDNKDYPPFDIPVEEITGIALVVGSVSLE